MGREEAKEQSKEAQREKEGAACAKKQAQRDKQWEKGTKDTSSQQVSLSHHQFHANTANSLSLSFSTDIPYGILRSLLPVFSYHPLHRERCSLTAFSRASATGRGSKVGGRGRAEGGAKSH